jgi:type VI secretion system protein ImpI
MILTLEVVGEQAEVLGPARRKVFDSIGGTIGRLPDNDWVFPDPYVSGRHALIRYLNGKFFVEDTSTNGVFVNSPDNRLPRDQSYQLKNGDLLYIDAYCIQVRIEKPSRAKEDANDPLDLLKAHALGGYTDKTVAMRDAEIDRTASLRPTSEEARTEWLFDSDVAAPAAIQAEERPVARAHTGAQTNATARTATRAPNGDPMQALLDSAGITDVEPSAELGQTLGEVLRTTLAGIMEALRARERVKDDLRLPGTSFQPQHNNPLKFSANVADAFHNLQPCLSFSAGGGRRGVARFARSSIGHRCGDARCVRSAACAIRSGAAAAGFRSTDEEGFHPRRTGEAALLGPVSGEVRRNDAGRGNEFPRVVRRGVRKSLRRSAAASASAGA